MFDWLIAALLGAIFSAAPVPVAETPDVEVSAPPTSTPMMWYDPTIGVEVSAEPWTPDIGSYPSGDYYNDICVPMERYPGFGTTLVGAIPCTP